MGVQTQTRSVGGTRSISVGGCSVPHPPGAGLLYVLKLAGGPPARAEGIFGRQRRGRRLLNAEALRQAS